MGEGQGEGESLKPPIAPWFTSTPPPLSDSLPPGERERGAERRNPLNTYATPAIGLLVLALLLSACENSFDPLTEGDVLFAVYGVLDMRQDTQFVRIAPTLEAARPETPARLDATAWTESPEHGTIAWTDSLVRLDDGTPAHLFYAPFRPVAGATYTLHVERSDGASTHLTTQVPARPQVGFALPILRPDAVSQPVLWRGFYQQPLELRVRYQVLPEGREPAADVAVRYADRGRQVPGGWQTRIDLDRDATIIRSTLDLPPSDTTTVLLRAMLETTWRSAGWDEAGDTTVTDGVGFLGSIAHFTTPWTVPDSLAAAVDLEDGQQR